MGEFQVAYVPIGVPTFHLESAQKEFEKSIELIQGLTEHLAAPKEMLLSIDLLKKFLGGIHPDLIILQNVTFANAAYASEVLRRFDCPILLWTLREPVIDGGRLRLNSLTGAYSAVNAFKAFRKEPLNYVFGAPQEEEVISKVGAVVRAAKLKHEIAHLKIAAIGHTPQGFGRVLDFGCKPEKNVTIFRIGKDGAGRFRFFIARGEALDKPKQFNGTSVVVKTETDAKKIVYESVEAGWEPHFVVIYGDVAQELEILAKMYNMEVEKY